MGTAEIPNAVLVIIFTGIALIAGSVLFSLAASAPEFYVKVPAGAGLAGVAAFSVSMVIACLADVPLWLSALISLIAGAAVAYWSIGRWRNSNYLTLAVVRARRSVNKSAGSPDVPQPTNEK
ncbi:hypothetical protein [Micromonospora inaquosa]|uniref:hypothetical protein n=1 Tax=Micromonospora inaquosa TaxID=2203716 RepID=UPI000F5EB557|nr:hypothetical protein [Micromonospora inaquosa]